MSALPVPDEGRKRSLPEPALCALAQAAEFSREWSAALLILQSILADMRDEAKKDEPLDSAQVDSWRQQMAWVIQRVDGDCDHLRVAVRESGFRHLLRE